MPCTTHNGGNERTADLAELKNARGGQAESDGTQADGRLQTQLDERLKDWTKKKKKIWGGGGGGRACDCAEEGKRRLSITQKAILEFLLLLERQVLGRPSLGTLLSF
ncbi:unnamed protein product [Citrullus colocynthis]|uniref:Uncharacterized protein n=1 Tax=Citrullus colocynthis TaxID=252529 RepID=A0ABP0YWS6_9ROSI